MLSLFKAFLAKILPDSTVAYLTGWKDLWVNYYYDATRYGRNAVVLHTAQTQGQLDGRIIATAHVLEKGLSLPETRLGFGKKKFVHLERLLDRYIANGYKPDRLSYMMAVKAVEAYVNYHNDRNHEVPYALELLEKLRATITSVEHSPYKAGLKSVTREQAAAGAAAPFAEFAASRHSLRQFTLEPLDQEKITRAIATAQHTPSVCNRQAWHVYTLSDEPLKEQALKIQGGNNGFTEVIDTAIIVAMDTSAFLGAKERNQAFVDGGMFSMSLLYALHAEGVGACPLNWSAIKSQDVALRKLLNIPDEHVIIMFIGVGNIPETYTVAYSDRNKPEDVLTKLS